MWHVVVCDQETSRMRRLKARYGAVENTTTMGCNAKKTNKQTMPTKYSGVKELGQIYSRSDLSDML